MKQDVPVIIPEHVPDRNLRELAAAVVNKAVKDSQSNDEILAIDAIYWLTGSDFPWWVEVAGLPFADPFKLLSDGKARFKTKARSTELVYREEHKEQDVLSVFEGLTPKQIKDLRTRIIPILRMLRDEIIQEFEGDPA